MNTNIKRSMIVATALGAVGVALACCSGGTDGESNGNTLTDDFVAGAGKTGDLTIKIVDNDMGVCETSGFGVKVVDSHGNGVQGIKVSCDSESGVAILEPQTGAEITDSGGNISGVLGCAKPGSYQFACRLAVGANIRKFADIECRPPVPTGCTGFTNAAGGGLGGGSDTTDDGGVGGTGDGVRITNALFIDNGDLGADATTTSNFSIDTFQDDCTPVTATPATQVEAEPYFETVAKVHVVNNTNSIITCSSADYTVSNTDPTTGLTSSGQTFTSNSIALSGEATAVDGSGGSGDFLFLVIQVVPGTGSADGNGFIGAQKKLLGASTEIPNSFGFKTVTLNLHCSNDQGEDFDLTSAQTLSFADFNHCNG